MTDSTLANRQAARDSFSGRTLTDAQFEEAWAVAKILNREIEKSGSFREKLTDYGHAFSRGEKFDALRGETILRDIYQGRYNETLNQTREGFIDREEALAPDARTRALAAAESIGPAIRDGATMPFYQAQDRAALSLAKETGLTELAAKSLMKETYQEKTGRDLYTDSKALEEAHHVPARAAQVAARKAETHNRTHQQSQS